MAGRVTLAALAWLLSGVLLAAVAWGGIAVHKATHPPRYRLDLTPADFHLPYEPLALTAADGVRLAGWRLVPPSPRGVVLVQHGYGTCRGDPLSLSALVYQGGYAAVSVDFRGHGESGGTCRFGRAERRDLRAVLDAVAADPRLSRLPIGYLGISMGAAIGILTAAEEPRIQAVVSDSAYARLGSLVGRYQRLAYGLPEIPFGWVTAACLLLALRAMDGSLDPVRAVGRLRCPIFIIHGEDDVSIPVHHARALAAAARAPKMLWIIPGATHVAGLQYAETDYTRRVLEFFGQHLRPA